jgi:hypothetical protein
MLMKMMKHKLVTTPHAAHSLRSELTTIAVYRSSAMKHAMIKPNTPSRIENVAIPIVSFRLVVPSVEGGTGAAVVVDVVVPGGGGIGAEVRLTGLHVISFQLAPVMANWTIGTIANTINTAIAMPAAEHLVDDIVDFVVDLGF